MFSGCTSLESFRSNETITSLGIYCFNRCNFRTASTSGCNTLGIGAYANNMNLTEFYFYQKSIPSYFFINCSSLVTVHCLYTSSISIGAYAFARCRNLNANALFNVGSFGDFALSGVESLQTYTTGAQTFGKYVFAGCSNLVNLTFTAQTSISGYSCANIPSLKHVMFYLNSAEIALTAFENSPVSSIGMISNDAVFYRTVKQVFPKLKKVIIQDSATKIPDYAFFRSSALEEVIIGHNVKEVGLYAFFECKNIRSFTYYGIRDPKFTVTSMYNLPELKYVYVYNYYMNESFCNYPVKKYQQIEDATKDDDSDDTDSDDTDSDGIDSDGTDTTVIDTNPVHGTDTNVIDTDTTIIDTKPVHGTDTNVIDTKPVHGTDTNVIDTDTTIIDTKPVHGTDTNVIDTKPVHGTDTTVIDTKPVHDTDTNVIDTKPVHGTDTNVIDTNPVHGTDTNVIDTKPVHDTDTNVIDTNPVHGTDTTDTSNNADTDSVIDIDTNTTNNNTTNINSTVNSNTNITNQESTIDNNGFVNNSNVDSKINHKNSIIVLVCIALFILLVIAIVIIVVLVVKSRSNVSSSEIEETNDQVYSENRKQQSKDRSSSSEISSQLELYDMGNRKANNPQQIQEFYFI
jgi:hypothetical protein